MRKIELTKEAFIDLFDNTKFDTDMVVDEFSEIDNVVRVNIYENGKMDFDTEEMDSIGDYEWSGLSFEEIPN